MQRKRAGEDVMVTFYRHISFDVKQRILMFYPKCLIFNKSLCYMNDDLGKSSTDFVFQGV